MGRIFLIMEIVNNRVQNDSEPGFQVVKGLWGL